MPEPLKVYPAERAAICDRLKSIETELTQLDATRSSRKEWAETWDRLLAEFFDLKERLGREQLAVKAPPVAGWAAGISFHSSSPAASSASPVIR